MTATFLGLPGELRNHIYYLYSLLHNEPKHAVFYDMDYLAPPLARVSHQVQEEILPIYVSAPWDTSCITSLKVCICDLNISPFLQLFSNIPVLSGRATDVDITFRFTDAAEIGSNITAPEDWMDVDSRLMD